MKKSKCIFQILLIIVFICISSPAFAKVTKSEGRCNFSVAGIDCKKIIADTHPSDWLNPYHEFQFRTTNGKGCRIRVDKSSTRLNNCKVSISSCYANKQGEWCSGIIVESLNRAGTAWNYDLNFNFDWK